MESSTIKVLSLWMLLIAACVGTYFLSNKIELGANAAANAAAAFLSGGGARHELVLSSGKIEPASVTARAGDEIVFTIKDGSRHNIAEERNQRREARLESGEIGKGESYSLVFQTAGTFYFYDRLNQDIRATIVVR